MITKYFRLFLFFFLIGNLLISCKNKSISTRLVSVSIPPQKYLTEQIAGDYLTVNVMIPPGMNPATCDLSYTIATFVSPSVIYLSNKSIYFLFSKTARISKS